MLVLAQLVGTGSPDDPFRVPDAAGIIDLRGDRRRRDGWAFAVMRPGASPPPGSLSLFPSLPDAATSHMAAAARQQLATRLGVDVPDTATGGEAIAYTLLDGDDSGRERWRKLRPTSRGLEVRIAGVTLFAAPTISGAAVDVDGQGRRRLTDDWSQCAATSPDISCGLTWVRFRSNTGGWNITSDGFARAAHTSTGQYMAAYADHPLGTSDHYAEAALLPGSSQPDPETGVFVRGTPGSLTWYEGAFEDHTFSTTAGLELKIWRVESGTYTIVAQTTPSTGRVPGDLIRITADGSTISLDRNGGEVFSNTDTAIASGTTVGLASYSSADGAFTSRWDSFAAQDLDYNSDAGAQPPSTSIYRTRMDPLPSPGPGPITVRVRARLAP